LRSWAILLAVAWAFYGQCAPVRSADDDIRYTIAKGDTLIEFGRKYLRRAEDYRLVQRANRIANPHSIPTGTTIRIPRSLLKFRPSVATLTSARGDVSAGPDNRLRNVVSGAELGEGDRLRTSAASSATLSLEDGSRITLPSNSDIRILRLRRYLLSSALDFDFKVDRGAARSKVAPKRNPADSYRIRTPKAVSAVRGTDFDTRYDVSSDRDFAEVVEGALAVGLGHGAPRPLPAGNGLAVNADGGTIEERLLPAPKVENAGKLQSAATVRFPLPAQAPGGTRVSIASDAGFQDIVIDTAVRDRLADIGPLEDGNYFVRFRDISAAGLEGIPSAYAFKRRLNSVSGSASGGDDGWQFKWSGLGKGTIRYHFQLFRGPTDGIPMIDEAGLSETAIRISDLPPGEYRWRIGSAQFVDGEANMSWNDFDSFVVTDN